ncbi:MAG: VOC family protein [Rhodocyclaceae bacterium]|nr:VOC family protein [Rhodocyclaceae bacterium]MCA3074746.1 VOC family protein [Rhodocyclaceae bacterium]MCA3091628.1 VOC family protein [Rhodocyclaceae bacterium]MCA3093980.1 VOC family protein [Rhodocyclaceae bacterium]MCA3099229.1 VOC family protein [Rhodocyclaceae bacterium]
MSAAEGVGTDGPFPAPQFSEVVLKTSNFARLKDWYENLLQVKAFFVRDDAKQASWTGAWGIAFIRLYHQHPYTQVLGLFEVPAVSGKADGLKGEPGLHHMQLRHQGLDHLFSRFEALRAQGIVPERAWNHGPGTSFYYRDPDGNMVELSAVNYADEEAYLAYYRSESYRRNVSGIEIDPGEYVAQYRSGVTQQELVRMPE